MGNLYTEKDFADVVDESGEVVGRAPKAWAGTDLLPAGQKIKGAGRSQAKGSDKGPASSQSTGSENEQPQDGN